jgi:16S rRNA processing protein RimM
MRWDEMVAVGRVARAHGLRGQVVVNPDTDFPEQRFQPGAEVFVNRNGEAESLTIASVRFHRDRPVIGFKGIDAIDDAEKLAGAELRVPADRLAALPDNAFYRHHLIGCVVESAGGERVGVVSGVEGTMSGSRLVVDGARGEILIPLAAEICTTVDVDAKRIVVRAPEGLLELNEPGAQRA